jgi:hypothetical protein
MTDDETIRGWLTGRLPADWFDAAPEVTVDREEILVVGAVAPPALAEGASEAERAAAVAGRVREFRERTRDQRMRIAQELQQLAGRTVSWGLTVDGHRELFTTASVPVMTRLRQPERQVLDTLVDAGVARSRSDALAWCVRLVGRNADAWLADLRTAMEEVARVRAGGPS